MPIQLRHFVAQHPHGAGLRKRRPRRAAPVKPDRANELWYKAELLKIVKLLRSKTEEIVMPVARGFIVPRENLGDEDLPQDMMQALNILAGQFGGIDTTAKRLAALAAQKNLGSVDKRLASSIKRSVNVDITGALTMHGGKIGTAMEAATKANVDLITSIPQQFFERIEKAIMENLSSGIRWEDFANVIDHIGDVTEYRAKLIARDQTSKMNSSFNQVRQTDLGINKYQWETAGDERVRDSHAENDGKVFSWDDPPEETGHPGEDIQCRCVAIPVFDLDDVEEEAAA